MNLQIDELTAERSEAAYAILERASAELAEIGFEGVAPWRVMSWAAFNRLAEDQPAEPAIADLMRLRGMLDKLIDDL